MKITRVCKAKPLGNFQKIESQAIILKNEIPKNMTLTECEYFHEKQARAINKALSETLPQGTYDRLGIIFMQHKISLYQGVTESAF